MQKTAFVIASVIALISASAIYLTKKNHSMPASGREDITKCINGLKTAKNEVVDILKNFKIGKVVTIPQVISKGVHQCDDLKAITSEVCHNSFDATIEEIKGMAQQVTDIKDLFKRFNFSFLES